MNQAVTQAQLVVQADMKLDKATMQLALFDEDGAVVVPTGLLQTGAEILLTGYAAGEGGAVLSTDSVNQAIAKVEDVATDAADVAASAASAAAVHDTGANVLMTSYAPHAVGSVLAADSLNIAMAKLEARIAVLEGA